MTHPTPPYSYKSATVKLDWLTDEPGNEILVVSNLYSVQQRQGHATELLKLVCEYADKYATRTVLTVGQYGNTTGLDNEGLIRFYEKFGFRRVKPERADHIFMERWSQKLHTL